MSAEITSKVLNILLRGEEVLLSGTWVPSSGSPTKVYVTNRRVIFEAAKAPDTKPEAEGICSFDISNIRIHQGVLSGEFLGVFSTEVLGSARERLSKYVHKGMEELTAKPSQPAQQTQSASSGTKFCPECGRSLPERSRFCVKCGAPQP